MCVCVCRKWNSQSHCSMHHSTTTTKNSLPLLAALLEQQSVTRVCSLLTTPCWPRSLPARAKAFCTHVSEQPLAMPHPSPYPTSWFSDAITLRSPASSITAVRPLVCVHRPPMHMAVCFPSVFCGRWEKQMNGPVPKHERKENMWMRTFEAWLQTQVNSAVAACSSLNQLYQTARDRCPGPRYTSSKEWKAATKQSRMSSSTFMLTARQMSLYL